MSPRTERVLRLIAHGFTNPICWPACLPCKCIQFIPVDGSHLCQATGSHRSDHGAHEQSKHHWEFHWGRKLAYKQLSARARSHSSVFLKIFRFPPKPEAEWAESTMFQLKKQRKFSSNSRGASFKVGPGVPRLFFLRAPAPPWKVSSGK